MGWTIDDLEGQAKRIRYDLTALQAKVSDLLKGLAEVGKRLPAEPAPHTCPECGLELPSYDRWVDHLANVHDERAPL